MLGHILYLLAFLVFCCFYLTGLFVFAVPLHYSNLQGTGGRRLCVTIEPALLLKGDIMVSSHGKEMTNIGPPDMGGVVIRTLELSFYYFQTFYLQQTKEILYK